MRCEEVRLELSSMDAATPEERAGLEAHLSSCGSCRADLAEIGEATSAAASFGVLPPTDLRASVLGAIEKDALSPTLALLAPGPRQDLKHSVMKAVAGDRTREASPAKVVGIHSRRSRMLQIVGAAAAALIIGVGLGAALGNNESSGPDVADGSRMPEGHETQILELEGMGPDELEVRHYRHDNFRLTLSVDGFEPTPAGFHYAVWVRGAGGDVSIGTFRIKRLDDFDIPFALGVNPSEFPELVITLEPNDGDPALTGEIVSSGEFDLATVHHGSYSD